MNGWKIAASLGGVGYFPKISGTVGSLVTLPFLWLLSHVSLSLSLGLLLAFFPFSVWAADRAGKAFGVPDDRRIVIDEALGLWIACFGLLPHQYVLFAVAFVAFRVFDIVKPWPASYFDCKVKNGFGVVMDDAVAGVYAMAVVQVVRFILTSSPLFR